MAFKNTRQPRRNGSRPLVQPALPLLPGLSKPKPTSANASTEPTELPSTINQDNSSFSRKSSDSRPISEAKSQDNDTPASHDAPEKRPASASDSKDEAEKNLIFNQAVRDIPSPEDQPFSDLQSPSESNDPPDHGADLVAAAELEPQAHVHQLVGEVGEEGDDHLTHTSSVEPGPEVNAFTATAQAQTSAEVNGQDILIANASDGAASQQTPTTQLRSNHDSPVDEGYAGNGHAHTSASPEQPVLYNGSGQKPQMDLADDTIFVSLSDHLLQLSHTKAWSDYAIVVNTREKQAFVCYAHSLVLIRSPRLRKMMERQASVPPSNTLTFFTPGPLIPHAFEAALRFLYSDSVLTAEALFPRHVLPDTQGTRAAILPYILSYWTSGLVMGIDHVTTRASNLLSDFLDWDVLELLTKEAEVLASGIDAEALESDIDWSDLVTQWKTIALAFCATKIDPRTVTLDTVSSTSLRSRFGSLEDSRGKHNPALASMVFGSMPSSADMSPTSPRVDVIQPSPSTSHTAISNILLNADYHDLVYFQHRLDRAWGAAGHQLMTDVVNEREIRRHKILSNQAIGAKQRMANSNAWDVVGFREIADAGEVRRQRVGFLPPPNR